MKRAIALIATLALASCATTQNSVDVYANPRAYLGQTVRVCGEYGVSNLLKSRATRTPRAEV